MEALGGLIVIAGAMFLYLLPTFFAYQRNVSVRGIVTVLNIFLGWTVVGWVVSLAMAFGPIEKRPEVPPQVQTPPPSLPRPSVEQGRPEKSDQVWKIGGLILVAFVVGIVLAFLFAQGRPSQRATAPSASRTSHELLASGEQGFLAIKDNAGPIPVFVTHEALRSWQNAAFKSDTYGVAEAGRLAMWLPSATRVLVLERQGFISPTVKVRILDGPRAGAAGFTNGEWVVRYWPPR